MRKSRQGSLGVVNIPWSLSTVMVLLHLNGLDYPDSQYTISTP